jgi:hypothetical protein
MFLTIAIVHEKEVNERELQRTSKNGPISTVIYPEVHLGTKKPIKYGNHITLLGGTTDYMLADRYSKMKSSINPDLTTGPEHIFFQESEAAPAFLMIEAKLKYVNVNEALGQALLFADRKK